MPEFTEELNEDVLKDIRRRIQEDTRRQQIGASGRASKRGLAGSTFEAAQLSQVGKAGQEAELSAALSFAFENATRQREERLIREDQQFRSAESGKGRTFSREERVGGQEFASGESRLGREAAIAEAARGRDFSSTEAELSRRFAGSEAQLGREFQTGEREASTDSQRRRDILQDRFRAKNLQTEQLFERFESQKDRELRIGEQSRGIVGAQDLLAQQQRSGGQQSALDRSATSGNILRQGRIDLERARIGETGVQARFDENLKEQGIQSEKDRQLKQKQIEAELFNDLFEGIGGIFGAG